MDLIRARARSLRKNPTEAEKVLWGHLRCWQVGGYKFRRQQPLGNYIVDFVCLEKKLIIELDGGQHAEQTVYDAERDAWLRDRGFSVLRFWNNDVLQNLNGVKDTILSKMESTPLPQSFPTKGEGGGLVEGILSAKVARNFLEFIFHEPHLKLDRSGR